VRNRFIYFPYQNHRRIKRFLVAVFHQLVDKNQNLRKNFVTKVVNTKNMVNFASVVVG